MPTFIVTANYTTEGVRGLMAGGPNRRSVIAGLIEAAGGTLKDMYMTTGDSDVMAIVEMPDATNGMAVNMAIGASGVASNFRTIRAWSPEEFEAIAETAARLSGSYTPPGG